MIFKNLMPKKLEVLQGMPRFREFILKLDTPTTLRDYQS
jgi:hypothetical protein